MKHKHQVKVSSKKGRTGAGKKYRRQENQDLKNMAKNAGKGGFRQRRAK